MNIVLTDENCKVPCPECERPYGCVELMSHLQAAHSDTKWKLTITIEPDYDQWDKQMIADQERLGADEFAARLEAGMRDASPQRQAALRLFNSMRFASDIDREQCFSDLSLLLGEPL